MAPKDYVGRGQAKKAQPPPRPPFPWIRTIITLLLVVGFAVFLWFIRDEKKDEVELQSQPTVKEVEPLPDPPKEKWEFMKILPDPNNTVEVDVPDAPNSGKTYVMQCGSFRTVAQAEEMRAKIAFQGLESQVKTSDGQNGKWHRVVLGPYDSKRNAERDRHKLQRAGMTTCRIW
ncbi:SPOR domain-containing protein [Paraneptunicella aestuarii]|uniref:SPOR domain-containing protein n=1 Tax=Paraneptunicella aestuarii TaxID=2831148 RepID=UPI001E63783A|nr:SPOR domain-containing protein [Paraneptunicella aestuarii]UAA39183.1 SPOR domain-containing protein [Paraneptunicella aestuarii]